MLITDWEPLTVWVYKQTYAKLATGDFDPNSDWKGVHLTNVVVNTELVAGDEEEVPVKRAKYLEFDQLKAEISDRFEPNA